MKSKRAMPTSAVGLAYLQGAFNSEDLLALESGLKENNLSLVSQATSPKYIMGIEDFFPQIQAFLSPDLVHVLCQGIATNAIYDGIKWFLFSLRQIAKKKTLTKVQNGKITTNVVPSIHFNIGQMHAVLPMDIDDEKYKYFVDKAFETISEQSVAKETYFIYSEKTGEARHYTQHELIQQAYQESQLDD